ncbi:MAG TPA: succinylglutamate desuccinylase/aspartoacylase family protein [Legionellaceae bacterium]|nr:succinylglutamate desuccinylase/aspartoacylase family protein [Legionellaceae bacterium]
MKNANLSVCNATIHPGESANLAFPLPEFYSCIPFYMPIKVIHGKKKGPCILVFSTVKGDELNGLEIINRLTKSIEPDHIAGTLIAIPVFNIFGLIGPFKHAAPENNLRECFPGSALGSYNERLAYILTQEILSKVDYCIELQTGSLNHELLPQICCNLNHSTTKQLAVAFTAPVITHTDHATNPLRRMIDEMNIPLLVYLAGEAMRFNEAAIKLGFVGTRNVMQLLEMIENDKEKPEFKPVFSTEQDWLRAPHSGILISDVELGQMIQQGERIGHINDPFGTDDLSAIIKATHNGIIVGINRHPLIHEGQTIFKIASFIDNNRAKSTLDAWGTMQTITEDTEAKDG